MYDRRLDGIVAAARLGSFSRAAASLHVSTPALVKQVSSFEAEYGIRLFVRSHTGVTPTPAGAVVVEEAQVVMERSREALRRARDLERDGQTVRMGVSLMSPGRQTLDLWPRVRHADRSLRLELVPVESLYAPGSTTMLHLGQDVDVIQTSFSTVRWQGACQLLHLSDASFYVDIPRTNRLCARESLSIEDLDGLTIRILRHANDTMDRLHQALAERGGATIVEVETFDLPLFNDAMEHGDAVLASGGWSAVHPGFAGVPLTWDEKVPTYLAYPLEPQPQVERFVEGVARLL